LTRRRLALISTSVYGGRRRRGARKGTTCEQRRLTQMFLTPYRTDVRITQFPRHLFVRIRVERLRSCGFPCGGIAALGPDPRRLSSLFGLANRDVGHLGLECRAFVDIPLDREGICLWRLNISYPPLREANYSLPILGNRPRNQNSFEKRIPSSAIAQRIRQLPHSVVVHGLTAIALLECMKGIRFQRDVGETGKSRHIGLGSDGMNGDFDAVRRRGGRW